ncbi:MAG: DUF5689 domain-containing protein [Gemmatimonadaceae bacterium]
MTSPTRGIASVQTGKVLTRAATLALLAICGCANDDPAPPFAPTGKGEIQGLIFFDADNNGAFTPVGGDTALAGVAVAVLERASTDTIAAGVTDAEGRFTLTGIPVGTHHVIVAEDAAVTGALVFCVNPRTASVYTNELAFLSFSAKLGCVVRIDQAEAEAEGTAVTVAGIVTAAQGTYRSDNVYIQDRSGGIQVFGLPSSLGLQLGDSVEVSGTLGSFGTELQIVSPRVAPNILSGAQVPAAEVETTGELAAAASDVRDPVIGTLVTVLKVTVGAFTSGGGRNANIDDGSGPIQVRLDGNVLAAVPTTTFQSGRCYDITGLVGIFNGGVQLKPRSLADVVEVPCS